MTVGVEEADRREGYVIGRTEYVDALSEQVLLVRQQRGPVLDAKRDVVHPWWSVRIAPHRRPGRPFQERQDIAAAGVDEDVHVRIRLLGRRDPILGDRQHVVHVQHGPAPLDGPLRDPCAAAPEVAFVPSTEAACMATAPAMLNAGLGVGLCIPYAAALVEAHGLPLRPLHDPRIRRTSEVFTRRGNSSSRPARAYDAKSSRPPHDPMQPDTQDKPLDAIVAAVQLPDVGDADFESSLAELRELAKTLGYRVVQTFVQKRASFDATAYLGAGKRDEISAYVEGRAGAGGDDRPGHATNPELDGVQVLLIDHEISPSQARNLEKAVGCEVMDRTMVILEIFHRHARSRAARAQVEIARLGYMAPRLREAAKLAGPQGRQRSGTGGRGAGESHTELDRRKIRDRIAELQGEIEAMGNERQTQRARRQQGEGVASVALVGYTNAGKSTLMRALTGSEVLVANKLFATLDTTVRVLQPESVPRVLVSDTVGFIKNLPHGLVESFKSTLDEALDASLLLHVIDASDPGFERQRQVTDDVLAEIGAQDIPRIRVFNKIDHVGDASAQSEFERDLRARYPSCIVMSARRAEDVARLRSLIVAFFQKDLIEAELLLPWSAQQLRGDIYATCEVLTEGADEAGAVFRVRGEESTIRSLRERAACDAVPPRRS